jgi:hypothetical protein
MRAAENRLLAIAISGLEMQCTISMITVHCDSMFNLQSWLKKKISKHIVSTENVRIKYSLAQFRYMKIEVEIR